jgi:hypothetical protein
METDTQDMGRVKVIVDRGNAIGWVVVKVFSPRLKFCVGNLATYTLEDIAGEENLHIKRIWYPPGMIQHPKPKAEKPKPKRKRKPKKRRPKPKVKGERGEFYAIHKTQDLHH